MKSSFIGTCRITHEMGAGGMAVVYRADQGPLERNVAIKRMRPELVKHSDLVERFRREAQAAAGLQHQNIVSILEFVADWQGSPAMIMEYVEGIDLHELIQLGGGLPPDVSAVIGLELASALEYAHYRQVVHRDIKPSNVLISKMGEVKLTDFGIAKDLKRQDLTQTGMSIGTPMYMSPEQVVGARLDFRSDIFAFGIVLYEMLAGHRPFEGDDQGTVLEKIRDKPHKPISKVNPSVPRQLARIVERCLRKNPDERYPDTAHLRQELDSFISKHLRTTYSRRLVAYLYHQGLVEEHSARHFVAGEILDHPEIERVDAGGPPMPPQARTNGIIAAAGVALLLWMGALALGLTGPPARFHPPTGRAASHTGTIRVVANPWARVYVDGRYVDVTPFAQAIQLPEGEHAVRLINDHLGETERVIHLRSGDHQIIRASFLE